MAWRGFAVLACLSWLASLAPVWAAGQASAATGGRQVVQPPAALSAVGVAGPILPARMRLDLTVVLRSSHPMGLAAFARAVSTPGSPWFRHFLAAGSFAARFGASPAAVATVTSALRDRGLSPGPVARDRLSLRLSGPVARIDQAFGTQLRWYRLPDGRRVFGSVRPATLPAAVAARVQAVLGLNDIVSAVPAAALRERGSPATMHPHRGSPSRTVGPQPCKQASAVASAYTANRLAGAYGFDSLYSKGDEGAGETVALAEFETYKGSDVSAYQACYKTHVPVTNVPVDGGATAAKTDVEAASDIEVLTGMAPQLQRIDVYEAPNNDQGTYDLYSKIISDDEDQVVSTSWAYCEPHLLAADPTLLTAEDTLLQEATAQGQGFFAAAGDTGSTACYDPPSTANAELAVNDPASQPYATGVGGTSLGIGSPDREGAWNDEPGAGGGGISAKWRQPSWQHAPGVVNKYSSGKPCRSASTICREVPDVSADADPADGYALYTDGQWADSWGTSFATPLWASLAAIADQACGENLGFLDPALYAVASAGGNSAFNDITIGNNDWDKTRHKGDYPATAGYDLASGLGSPVAGTLVPDLCSPHAGGSPWRLQGAAADSEYSSLAGVSCPSATACTAVGSAGGSTTDSALAERWNRTGWSVQSVPSAPGSVLGGFSGVSCPSVTVCIAVGDYDKKSGFDLGLAEGWNGTRWSIQPTPSIAGTGVDPLGVSCSSATACTAVGSYGNNSGALRALVERWNGTKWIRQAAPSGSEDTRLNGVSCPSANVCVAVGNYYNRSDIPTVLTERWNGTKWSVQSTPTPAGARGAYLSGVSCSSTTACTAVGYYLPSASPLKTLAERWNGTRWSIQATPNPKGSEDSFRNGLLGLMGVSCSAETSCTAAGSYENSSGDGLTLAEQWNGTNWTIQRTPNTAASVNYLFGVSCPSDTTCSAVGFSTLPGQTALAERRS